MANMARHGSAGNATFNGFSVFQPTLGATLQWLPQIGTPELDDMINAFLPGPASIGDKRAHIAMDFFEYSRLTGETTKFYPVMTQATTPVASPYDSGYGSNFNTSPVVSDLSSWTQSPVAFAPVEDLSAPRTTAKKSSASSTVDFASHPGMRIMTKDGRDVTNSASRGCKTKEQRDHAHLMRIIKACDACKRKKIRCDPSHRKRTGSQASTSPTEAKVTKKAKKTQKSAPVNAAPPPADSLAADALMAPEMTIPFSDFDTTFNAQELDDLWRFVDFDQSQPLAVANDFSFNDFVFDSFTDTQSFSTPSSASANSPSHVFAQSPAVVSDFSTEVSTQTPALPYMNPDVAHGTNYVDFNLYSPSPSYYDEDPVFLQTDVSSRHSSVGVNNATGLPQDLPSHVPSGSVPSSPVPLQATDQRYEYNDGSPHGSGLYGRTRYIAPGLACAQPTSSSSSSVGVENVDSAVARDIQSLVSPSTNTRPGVIPTGALDISPTSSSSRGINVAGEPRHSGILSSAIIPQSSQPSPSVADAMGVDGCQSRRDIAVNNVTQSSAVGLGTLVPAGGVCRSVPRQRTALQCAVENGHCAMLAMIRAWTSSPARRILAEKDGKEVQSLQLSPVRNLSQLVVFGLVSMLCANSSVSQINNSNNNNAFNAVIAMALISLVVSMTLIQWCVGPPGATCVASKGLQIPKSLAAGDCFQSLVGRRGRDLLSSASFSSFMVR
ncbi:hypothetical protein QBC43DRAFT_217609 [Cladorrhinum sp. PSN259]|nr:hypothetical protein QBC43DRAFT_217609 [Cladorrhinum sp. PSN259]